MEGWRGEGLHHVIHRAVNGDPKLVILLLNIQMTDRHVRQKDARHFNSSAKGHTHLYLGAIKVIMKGT